jgi:hypothetical protein
MRLRDQIASLRGELDRDVGAINAQKLLTYFQEQAGQTAAASLTSSDGAAATAAASCSGATSPNSSGGGGGAVVEHSFVLSLVPLAHMDASITRVYQLIYLQEELARCQAILMLASTGGGGPAGAATTAAADNTATGQDEARNNVTPRTHSAANDKAALLSTSNLTLKRQLLLHRRPRVATAGSATRIDKLPGSVANVSRGSGSAATGSTSSASTASAAGGAQPGGHSALSRTSVLPARGAPRSQRQRK